jgi:hypothetical protein
MEDCIHLLPVDMFTAVAHWDVGGKEVMVIVTSDSFCTRCVGPNVELFSCFLYNRYSRPVLKEDEPSEHVFAFVCSYFYITIRICNAV